MYVINHDKKYLIYMYPKSGCSTLRVLHAYLSHSPQAQTREHFEDAHHGIQRRDDDNLLKNWDQYTDYCKVLVTVTRTHGWCHCSSKRLSLIHI